MLDKMDKEVRAFEDQLIQLVWVMRGASLNEIYALSPTQRIAMQDLYKKNLETTKDTGLPFF